MSATDPDVLVVGAGLAGLVAARRLRSAGQTVKLVDKGRSVGGRLATRRMGDARVDHGAQFFTVRGPAFDDMVVEARAAGVVHEWCRGFADPPDGHPRFVGSAGMNGLAKWLASDLDVELARELHSVRSEGGRWHAEADGWSVSADALVLTPPVPQSLTLLDKGAVALDARSRDTLQRVRYFKTLALLATLDGQPAVPHPGGVQLDQSEPFTFVADNQAKGVSTAPAITLHANHAYSDARYDDDPAGVLAELRGLAAPWIGSARIVEAQLKKWRYAGPIDVVPQATLVTESEGAPVAFAGDAFGGPKVEGAFNSGRAAGAAIAERLAP